MACVAASFNAWGARRCATVATTVRNGRSPADWAMTCATESATSLGIRRCRGSVLCVKRHRKRIYTSLIEGKTLAVCRRLPVCRDGGRIGPRLNNGGVDAKGSKFIAIRFGEPLQGKFRRSIEAKKRKGQPSSNGPDLQQQTTALLTHLWQNRTVHPQDAKDVRRKLLLDLLKGECFERTTVRYPCIVDHH